MHFLVEFIKARVPANWIQNSSGWTMGNCPMCVINGEARNDQFGRGGFNFSENEFGYHCFNCGFVTGWKPGSKLGWRVKTLMKQLGVEEADLQRLALNLLREEESLALISRAPLPKPIYHQNWPTVELPPNSVAIEQVKLETAKPKFIDALHMLKERKLLNWPDWAYSTDWKYRNRLLLPYRYKNNIVGYNARFIGISSKENPKYMLQKPEHFVFNLDHQTADRKFVIVHEGDYDAIGTDGVSLGTNSASNEQCSILDQLNRRIILLPDADAPGTKLIDIALSEEWSVSFPEWLTYHKDANSAVQEYGRSFVLKSILAAAIDNPTKIKVLTKKYCK